MGLEGRVVLGRLWWRFIRIVEGISFFHTPVDTRITHNPRRALFGADFGA